MSISIVIYVDEFKQYPGCYDPNHSDYIWVTRIFEVMGHNRNAFSCPAAGNYAWWDTNYNGSLGGAGEDGNFSAWTVSSSSSFSLGYNDWGLDQYHRPQLGLGGDVNGMWSQGPVREGMVKKPTEMIMVGDTRGLPNGQTQWGGNIKPSQGNTGWTTSQWPSNRHNYRTDFLFADGHFEAAKRTDTCDPANTAWRRRWNNDNLAHDGTDGDGLPSGSMWNYSVAAAGQLDPSY